MENGHSAPALDAARFARPVGDGKDHGYRFGLDAPLAAAALRQLAERIEAGDAIVVKVHSSGLATADDWAARSLVVRYVQKEARQ